MKNTKQSLIYYIKLWLDRWSHADRIAAVVGAVPEGRRLPPEGGSHSRRLLGFRWTGKLPLSKRNTV